MSQFLLAMIGCHALYSLGGIRQNRPPNPGYQKIVFGMLLAGAIAGALLWPSGSGYALALPWLALVMLPVFFSMQLNVAVRQDNRAGIMRSTRWLNRLYPGGGWRYAQEVYLTQAAIIHGRWADAMALLEAGHTQPGPDGLTGTWMQLNRLTWLHDWTAILSHTNSRVASDANDQVFFGSLRVRALAELGRWDECLAALEQLASWAKRQDLASIYLPVLALAGQVEPARRLLKASAPPPSPVSEYWIGVAWLAAGDHDQGARILEAAARAGDSTVQEQVRWRLETTRRPNIGPHDQERLQRMIAAWPLLAGRPATAA